MRSIVVCVVLLAVAVSADLQSDFDDINSHLPWGKINAIGKKYVAAYPSYAAALRFVDKLSYDKVIKDFLSTKEGQSLAELFKRYGVDAESLLAYSVKMNVELSRKWLEPITEEESKGPAISGNIMADIQSAMLDSDFFTAVHDKMQSSEDFANFVAAVTDPAFRYRFYRASMSKELFGKGKSPEVRGFWSKVWKVTKGVAIASAILG